MKSLTALGLIGVLALPALARAQTVPVPIPLRVEKGTFAAGTQYYEADLSGFREYLETIRSDKPQLYATLDDELDGAETRRTLAHVLMWGVGVGGGLAVLGTGLLLHDDCSAYTQDGLTTERDAEDLMRCSDDATTQDLTFTGASIGVFAGGMISGLLLLPGRPTFLRLINHHNRIEPAAPVTLGLNASRHHASARLTLSF